MALQQIANTDLTGKGVQGQPDVPGLTAAEMQTKVEEIVRDVVIPKFNANAGNTYDKTEVNSQIDTKMQSIGAGDMAKSVYDPEAGAKQMAFKADVLDKATYKGGADGVVKDSDKLGGQLPEYYDTLAKLSPSAYSTDGITFVGCTHADGGYVKIGKLVIVNMRVAPTAAGSNLTIATGLPAPLSAAAVYVCGIARIVNAASSCYINAGALTVDGAISTGGAVSVFMIYFAV